MNKTDAISKEDYSAAIITMSESLGVDAETAISVMEICAVETPEQLYAKYLATSKTDTLFARAVGIEPEEWADWMQKLRSNLSEETVKVLETPIAEDELQTTGYRPGTKTAEEDVDDAESHDETEATGDRS